MTLFGSSPGPDEREPSQPWACQLISFEIAGGVVVLDLIALEDRPGFAMQWPRSTPFTVHLAVAHVPVRAVERVLRAWTDSSDVVAITHGETDGRVWLNFASDNTRLVTHLADPSPGSRR
ncbi:hypothetical protein [Desertimonas flava]|uniref:hypothetical protein n=1 Tax=Desertimonas flava TaxID=2064846 RepID=UPI000E34F2D5|nr:hypothetical protein [Desertimonas flava]